jgi:hypothetical protein
MALVQDPCRLQVLDVPQELFAVELGESQPFVHVHPGHLEVALDRFLP